MFLVIKLKTFAIHGLFFILIIFCAVFLLKLNSEHSLPSNKDLIDQEEMSVILQELFNYRNRMLLANDIKKIELLYDTGQTVGRWAFEHQARRMRYLHNWADKQGVRFIDIKTKLRVRWVKKKKDTITSNIVASTEYKYIYEDALPQALTAKVNMFRIGTYHLLDLKILDQKWLIGREWYTDPFADSLRLDNIKTKENKERIKAGNARDFSQLEQRRLEAVAYADRYCGAVRMRSMNMLIIKNTETIILSVVTAPTLLHKFCMRGGSFGRPAFGIINGAEVKPGSTRKPSKTLC